MKYAFDKTSANESFNLTFFCYGSKNRLIQLLCSIEHVFCKIYKSLLTLEILCINIIIYT